MNDYNVGDQVTIINNEGGEIKGKVVNAHRLLNSWFLVIDLGDNGGYYRLIIGD